MNKPTLISSGYTKQTKITLKKQIFLLTMYSVFVKYSAFVIYTVFIIYLIFSKERGKIDEKEFVVYFGCNKYNIFPFK